MQMSLDTKKSFWTGVSMTASFIIIIAGLYLIEEHGFIGGLLIACFLAIKGSKVALEDIEIKENEGDK